MNLTRLSVSGGIDYLLSTAATGDVAVKTGDLTAYYAAGGTPPGRWFGAGVESLGLMDNIEVVSLTGAERLFKHYRHPVTDAPLGSPPRSVGGSSPVAGFDCTFTIPKSVSVMWALGDPAIQSAIAAAHERAVTQALEWIEREVIQTRSGKGGVASEAVTGIIAARFDHFDTRDGDPHLHTHAVISNKVARVRDGVWRTVDSRALHKAGVAASELHENLILDELARTVGMTFTERSMTSNAVVMDVDGVDREVIDHFSSRTWAVTKRMDEMTEHWIAAHGSQPTKQQLREFKAIAWRESRQAKDKDPAPLAQMIRSWRTRLSELGSVLPTEWEPSPGFDPALRDRHMDEAIAKMSLAIPAIGDGQYTEEEIASHAVQLAKSSKATWTRANLRAHIERMTRHVRVISHQSRIEWVDELTDHAIGLCTPLSHARYEQPKVDDRRLWWNGASVFDSEHTRIYTHQSVLDSEQRVLDAAAAFTDLGMDREQARSLIDGVDAAMVEAGQSTYRLGGDQVDAGVAVLADGKRISSIIGPAGTGKTSTMSRLTAAWQHVHGDGSVVGLAVSAQAAAVLGEDLGAPTVTMAKWMFETIGDGARKRREDIEKFKRRAVVSLAPRRWQRRLVAALAKEATFTLKPGQLVIVDEASMAGTFDLAELTKQIEAAGAKMLLVGDGAQLDSPAAGGILAHLDRAGQSYHLESIHRFVSDWEKDASLALRQGQTDVVEVYREKDRIRVGSDEDMFENAYQATRADLAAGKSSILISATNVGVKDLNERFMIDRRAAGEVNDDLTVNLRDGLNAGVGEVVLARKVQRMLRDDAGDFIRNGTLLTVTDIDARGQITATRSDNGAAITLPADYVREHLELGYALTAHRAQGSTVDTGHVVVPTTASMPRELLYVAMTRGKEANTAWVAEDQVDDEHIAGGMLAEELPTWKERLESILATSGAELTATTTHELQHDSAHSLARLVAEKAHLLELADIAIDDHARDLAAAAVDGLIPERAIGTDESEGARRSLTGHLAWLTARGHDPRAVLDQALSIRELRTADDVEAVATWRIQRDLGLEKTVPDMDEIAERDPNVHQALQVNRDLTISRYGQLRDRAHEQPWARRVPRTGNLVRDRELLLQVAIYRDTYGIDGLSPLGPAPHRAHAAQLKEWKTIAEAMSPDTDKLASPTHVPTARKAAHGPEL